MFRPTISLKGRALRFLSQREHSRSELERKLTKHVQEGEDLRAILDDLQAKDFISDTRVIESVVNRRASVMGAARIRQELHAKGIKGDEVQEAMAQLQGTELERAREVWERKFGTPAQDPKERMRQMRFLMSRGFSGSVTSSVLRGAQAE